MGPRFGKPNRLPSLAMREGGGVADGQCIGMASTVASLLEARFFGLAWQMAMASLIARLLEMLPRVTHVCTCYYVEVVVNMIDCEKQRQSSIEGPCILPLSIDHDRLKLIIHNYT